MSGNDTSHNTELRPRLEEMLRESGVVWEILTRVPQLQLSNWYLGAGCLAQTVWNDMHHFPSASNIRVYNLVYFDSSDLSGETEDSNAVKARRRLAGLSVELDVANEARVHIWYLEHFGFAIQHYSSVEDGIASRPTTVTAIGVRMESDGKLTVCAPFGLEDLLGLIVRPNKRQVTKTIYDKEVERWSACWPRLTIVPWD